MEKIYRTPEKHLYPLHLVRPRFKNNLEDVLFYMAKEINDFNGPIDNESLNDIISKFPGNSHISTKTLSNWRTEISTLFGLMQYNDNYGYYPSNITKRLSEKEDLIEFFKNFSIKLQFPSGILKSHVNKELIERNINFLPFKFTIELLYILKSQNKNSAYITKDELTYIVFDDIRFTTNKLKPSDASKIILHNRELNYSYEKHPYTKGYTKESKGDQTRTSFDFLDYMQYGNLLIKKGDKYYLNEIEEKFIQYAYKKTDTFTFFDRFYNSDINIKDIGVLRRNRRNFRYPSLRPATNSSKSIISLLF
ncbi:hypothetical protein WAX88_21320 (plasmid) [Photobacterium damselae subsp. damselae]|uniref:hypothetical protein n=1 Tax=Photobacterium damselae TaxID=38293 RepID=UPI00311AF190